MKVFAVHVDDVEPIATREAPVLVAVVVLLLPEHARVIRALLQDVILGVTAESMTVRLKTRST